MFNGFSPFLWFVVFVVTLYFLQVVTKRNYRFQCARCGYAIDPSVWVMMLTPHRFGYKRLRCPQCGARTWAMRVPRR